MRRQNRPSLSRGARSPNCAEQAAQLLVSTVLAGLAGAERSEHPRPHTDETHGGIKGAGLSVPALG